VSPPARVDVAVVGGGAAGLFAALFAARGGAQVVLLDGARRLGAKILVSGGGRCNVTNARVAPEDFWLPRSGALAAVLRAFAVERTLAFFQQAGVALHEEERGKLFPDSNRARSVLDALVGAAREAGVRVATGARVTAVERAGTGFRVVSGSGTLAAARVVLATGGMSLPKSGSDGFGYALARRLGHSLVAPVPALEPLVAAGRLHAELSGVSLEAALTVRVEGRRAVNVRGPLLLTHFGVSGPAALDASRFWRRAEAEGRERRVTLSLVPGQTPESADAWLQRQRAERPRASLGAALAGVLPASVADAVVAERGLGPALRLDQLRRGDRLALAAALAERPLEVTGGRGWNHAEVTSGGVPLAELDAGTLGSKRCPGLHLAGEIVDVDGRLGGFNFQWAWASGFVAGTGAARGL